MTRILIVEDDPAQLRALARAFAHQRPDLTIVTATNGSEATRVLGERAVDLVLTDLQMPEMDGFELLAWILGHSPETPVCVMSAFGTDETPARLDGLGAVEFFSKPVDAKSVLARLTDTIAQSIRGHVHNVSLASFLQLMEMERKTCNLKVTSDEQSGVLFVRRGVLVDAQAGDLRGEEAAVSIVAWPNPSITICRHSDSRPPAIEKSLGFIVMEAMRVQDELARDRPIPTEGSGSVWPVPRRSWYPSRAPSEPATATARTKSIPPEAPEFGLPSGARAIAVVDSATGKVLRAAMRTDCPMEELANMAAVMLQHEATMLRLCDAGEGIEELVLSTTTRCDVIRPLGANATEFALLVFAPEETNLVMARLELERFIAASR